MKSDGTPHGSPFALNVSLPSLAAAQLTTAPYCGAPIAKPKAKPKGCFGEGTLREIRIEDAMIRIRAEGGKATKTKSAVTSPHPAGAAGNSERARLFSGLGVSHLQEPE